MALINCPECGKEVSDAAELCPNCGYSIKKHKKKPQTKKIIMIAAVAIAILISSLIVFFVNRLDAEEQASVDNVMTAITNIGEINTKSEAQIAKVERSYNALSGKCQRHVENYDELVAAREDYNNLRAEEAIEYISKIGEVTLNSQETIDKAKDIYDLLSDEQKTLVTNGEDLFSAIEQLSNLRIDDADAKIAAIGVISLESQNKIGEARKAYDLLSDEEKTKVGSYKDLSKAEEDYENLTVSKCISLIDSIGTVTLESGEKIKEARSLYSSFSKESKDKITNYSILAKADMEYAQLVWEEEERKRSLNPGDSFSTASCEITYSKTSITNRIAPNKTSGAYLYYSPHNENEIFLDSVFQIKNIDTDNLWIENLVSDYTVEYDGRILTKPHKLYTSGGSDISAVYSWDSLYALETTTLHVVTTMPGEIKSNDKPLTVKFTIAGEEKIIHVR